MTGNERIHQLCRKATALLAGAMLLLSAGLAGANNGVPGGDRPQFSVRVVSSAADQVTGGDARVWSTASTWVPTNCR